LAGLCLLVCSFLSFQAYRNAGTMQEAVELWSKELSRPGNHCYESPTPDPEHCAYLRKYFESAVEGRDVETERADHFRTAAWLGPLALLVLYFGGRWSLTGSIRPLFPLKARSS
jgi:hypothetical protein